MREGREGSQPQLVRRTAAGAENWVQPSVIPAGVGGEARSDAQAELAQVASEAGAGLGALMGA